MLSPGDRLRARAAASICATLVDVLGSGGVVGRRTEREPSVDRAARKERVCRGGVRPACRIVARVRAVPAQYPRPRGRLRSTRRTRSVPAPGIEGTHARRDLTARCRSGMLHFVDPYAPINGISLEHYAD